MTAQPWMHNILSRLMCSTSTGIAWCAVQGQYNFRCKTLRNTSVPDEGSTELLAKHNELDGDLCYDGTALGG
jgi:hypothetical protein